MTGSVRIRARGFKGALLEGERQESGVKDMNERPKEMVVDAEWDTDGVSASIVLGDEEQRVRFAASEEVGKEADFLLPATMPLAMKAAPI